MYLTQEQDQKSCVKSLNQNKLFEYNSHLLTSKILLSTNKQIVNLFFHNDKNLFFCFFHSLTNEIQLNLIPHPIIIVDWILRKLNLQKDKNFVLKITKNEFCNCTHIKSEINQIFYEITIEPIFSLVKDENMGDFLVDMNSTFKPNRNQMRNKLNKLYGKLLIFHLSLNKQINNDKSIQKCKKCKSKINTILGIENAPYYLTFEFQFININTISLSDALTLMIMIPKIFEINSLFERSELKEKHFYALVSVIFISSCKVYTIAVKNENDVHWKYHTHNHVKEVINCAQYLDVIITSLKRGDIPIATMYKRQTKYCEEELSVDDIDTLERYAFNSSNTKENTLRVNESVMSMTIGNELYNSVDKGYAYSNKTSTSNSTTSKNGSIVGDINAIGFNNNGFSINQINGKVNMIGFNQRPQVNKQNKMNNNSSITGNNSISSKRKSITNKKETVKFKLINPKIKNRWKCDICDTMNPDNVYRCTSCKTINLYKKEIIEVASSPISSHTPSKTSYKKRQLSLHLNQNNNRTIDSRNPSRKSPISSFNAHIKTSPNSQRYSVKYY